MIRFFTAIEKGLNAGVRWLVILLMLAMTGMVFMQVVMRYVFNAPIGWAEELPRFAFVGISFLGAAALLRREKHIQVMVFFDRFPSALQWMARFISHIGALICIGFFFKGGVGITFDEWMQLAPASQFPMGWVYMVIPVSAFLMMICTLINLTRNIRELIAERRS
ncbi:MAG TPA: TRAP transporter small permease [Deltaproteobacteria bacterium]|nr:TRAP transporter small permease [Deltaproteobacteria bacterium]